MTLNATSAGRGGTGSRRVRRAVAGDGLLADVAGALDDHSSSDAVHWSRPLVASLIVFGSVTLIWPRWSCWPRSFLTTSLNFSAFGLDFVPALVGEHASRWPRSSGRALGVGDAGGPKGERRHGGDEEGLTQVVLLYEGLILDEGAGAGPPRRGLPTTRQ